MGSNPAWIIPVIGLTGAVSPGAASISQREGEGIIVPERRPLSDDRTNDGFGLDGATGARDPADVGGKFSIRAGVSLGAEVAADHFDCGVVHYFRTECGELRFGWAQRELKSCRPRHGSCPYCLPH